jgi:hypothetical protein
MPTVTLSRYECSADLVPPVCALCGEPGTDRVPHTFSWRPSWKEAAGPGDWSAGRTATIRLPLCAEHVSHTRRKNRFVAFTVIPVLALMAVAIAPIVGLQFGLERIESLVLGTGAMVLVLAWTGALHLFCRDRFQAVEITDRFVTLRGVHGRFVAAVEGELELGPERPDVRVPEAAADAGTGPPSGATEVTLTEREYQSGHLPPVCARCGAQAGTSVPRRVRLFPHQFGCLWIAPLLATVIFCPPLYVLLLVTIGRRVDVRVPVCPEHEGDWVVLDRVTLWLVLPIWSLVATALTVCAVLDPRYRWWYVGGSVLTLIAVVAIQRVRGRGRVFLAQAEGTDVRMRRVHPAFAAAVAAMRPAQPRERPARRHVEDEWDDYDDEPMGPRPRRSRPRDDWDDDDPDRRPRRPD